jgi:hypothetical protein
VTDPLIIEIQHWTHPRLPAGHRLSERWSILLRGKSIMTFESELEARRVATGYGWTVAANGIGGTEG